MVTVEGTTAALIRFSVAATEVPVAAIRTAFTFVKSAFTAKGLAVASERGTALLAEAVFTFVKPAIAVKGTT